MTAWSVAPARGRFRICGTCGAKLAFVEVARPSGATADPKQLIAVVRRHIDSSARCHNTSTFSSGMIVACRCERPMPLPREDELVCARCEGLIAPEVSTPIPGDGVRGDRPSGGSS
jgi:hypothetical protein